MYNKYKSKVSVPKAPIKLKRIKITDKIDNLTARSLTSDLEVQ